MTQAQKIKFTILHQEEFSASDMMPEEQALTELGGCSDNGSELGLGAWQIEFDVEVTNQENEAKVFTVVFQPEERSNGMKNYSGYDVALGVLYGCDADESNELSAFCDYDDTVIDALHAIAQKKAEQELERLMPETTFLMNPATGSVDTEENWLADIKEWETADDKTPQEQFDSLIEVVKDINGDWVEAK